MCKNIGWFYGVYVCNDCNLQRGSLYDCSTGSGKGAIPVFAIVVLPALVDAAATAGAFADHRLILLETGLVRVGNIRVGLHQLPRHSFNAPHEAARVGLALCDLRQGVFPFSLDPAALQRWGKCRRPHMRF